MAPIVQPYNLFAQQKMAGYPSYQQVPQQNPQPQQVIPGQVAGETVDEFAQGKFNNGQPVAATPQTKPAAVTTPLPLKPAGTVDNLSGTGFASQGNGQQKPITSTEDLAKAMGYTSPEEENRLRKASVANQRMLAVVDALRHIGNIAHTVNYAPSQQFNSPVMEERKRYLQGKALRDKANQTYISYQQAKAAQDAKQRQWEAEQKQKADQWNANFKFNAAKAAAELAERQRQYDSNLAFNKDKWKEQADLNERKFKQQEAHQRASLGLGYARLNETKRHNNVMEGRGGTGSGGSRGGSRSQATIYSRRGYLTKAGATDADMKRVYDNLYEWGKKRGKRDADGRLRPYIDEGGILAGISPDLYGGKKISDVSKREAVDRMIMEHDDAAVELAQKYGFQWHEQTPAGRQRIEGFGGGGAPDSSGNGKERIAGFGGY